MRLLPFSEYDEQIIHIRSHSITAAGLVTLLLAAPLPASATLLQFSLDTSSLFDTDAILAFDFIDGDGEPNNTVTISDFFMDGGNLADPETEGEATGTLIPGPVTLTDGTESFFNSFLQPLTFGKEISFTLTLTEEHAAGSLFADSFSFSLLDNNYLPLFNTTDDPFFSGGALFQVDIDGSPGGVLQTFAPVDPDLAVSWSVGPIVAVPLPSTASLMFIGVGLLGGIVARRRVRQPPY